MTCIVGYIEPKTKDIYMGADSASVGGYFSTPSACGKVFINGGMIFGFTSSWRMGQLLEHSLKIPEHRENVDIKKYMVTTFIDAVRQCLKDGGFARKNNEEESGGTFLVGYRGRLFQVEDDYQVNEMLEPYDACGCGYAFALGSMFTAAKSTPPRVRVHKALEAAAMFSAGVRPPFNIKVLKGPKS